jgi:hypothetical protein
MKTLQKVLVAVAAVGLLAAEDMKSIITKS